MKRFARIGMAATVAALALYGCRGGQLTIALSPTGLGGAWGGNGIILIATESEATFEFDCAHGTIARALTADTDGKVDVTGTYFREHGGPVHQDEQPDVHPARYHGRVLRGTLTLTITLTDSGQDIGSYTLVRGEQGLVHKCL